MRKLYCFDFDGTLTNKDTMFLFLRFYNRKKYTQQFLKFIPVFTLLKLKLVKPETVKKSFIASILKGETKENLALESQKFFDEYYPEIIRENALDFINAIDFTKTTCFMVTASLDIWTKPFADQFNMKLLATRAEYKNGIFTGNFIGKNCNGKEKVNRIKKELPKVKYDKSIAFGDSTGDLPMLNWADESHYRFFH